MDGMIAFEAMRRNGLARPKKFCAIFRGGRRQSECQCRPTIHVYHGFLPFFACTMHGSEESIPSEATCQNNLAKRHLANLQSTPSHLIEAAFLAVGVLIASALRPMTARSPTISHSSGAARWRPRTRKIHSSPLRRSSAKARSRILGRGHLRRQAPQARYI